MEHIHNTKFMKPEVEVKIIQNKLGKINKKIKNEIVNIVNLANLVRNSLQSLIFPQ